jgi:predicted nucleotidyltransferase
VACIYVGIEGPHLTSEAIEMHNVVSRRTSEIADLAASLGVRHLGLFGSAADGDFDETSSDVDFVVEFDMAKVTDYFDTYFSLKEGLEQLLGRPVDLVVRSALENPYFLRRLAETEVPLYAA